MKKSLFAAALAALLSGCSLFRGEEPVVRVVSPDGRNEIRAWAAPLSYEVLRDGVVVVARSEIGMTIGGRALESAAAPRISRLDIEGNPVPTAVYKKDFLDLSQKGVVMDFDGWGLALSARNDGVAYRFVIDMPGDKVRVNGEKVGVTIPDSDAKCSLYYGSAPGCEENIPLTCKAGEIVTGKDKGRDFVYLPFAYETDGRWVAVTESDVYDYPILDFVRDESASGVKLVSKFAGFPKGTHHATGWDPGNRVEKGGRWIIVDGSEDWLVETEGRRLFPWRVFILADSPSGFAAADIVNALARPQANYDFSWVRPGKVAWDWWNAWDNQGGKGCTTATYKRFIDFAAKTGVEYVIMDEGWSETLNIWKFHRNVDVPEVIRYANSKGVGIILWMAWAQIAGDEDRVASHFARLGAKGFKVDFMDRGDAEVERFLWKFADACARNRMVVDYHGAHRPTGMSRAYPNVLNYEGVHGLECTKWYRGEDFPDNDVKQFFLRMTAGPMDYTPGAMDNYPLGRANYKGSGDNPGSVGTRCHQMALMVAYEAPLQMLCDAPTKYERNMESFGFMVRTPVVWADTVGLGGCPDSYAAIARKAKDGSWYAAAVNNSTAREIEIDTSFLGSGEWAAEAFSDAADSDVAATHYVRETGRSVKAGDRIRVAMAPGGGYVARFVRR